MLFGTEQKLANASFKIQLHGSDIEKVRNFCYLGVTLDKYLSWKERVSKVFTKVDKRLGLLGRIRSCLTLKAPKLRIQLSRVTSPVLHRHGLG